MTSVDVSKQATRETDSNHVGVQEQGTEGQLKDYNYHDSVFEFCYQDYTNLQQEAEYLLGIVQKLNAEIEDKNLQIEELRRQFQEQPDALRPNPYGEQIWHLAQSDTPGCQISNIVYCATNLQDRCDYLQAVCGEQEVVIYRLRKEVAELQSKSRDKEAFLLQLIETSTELKVIRKDRDKLAIRTEELEKILETLNRELATYVDQTSELRQENDDLQARLSDFEGLNRRLESEQLKAKQLEIHVGALKLELEKHVLQASVAATCLQDAVAQDPEKAFPIKNFQTQNPALSEMSKDTGLVSSEPILKRRRTLRGSRKEFIMEPSSVKSCKNCSALFPLGKSLNSVECRFHACTPQPYKTWRTYCDPGSITNARNALYWPCCEVFSPNEPKGCRKLKNHVFSDGDSA
ncbi:hypothetical protein CHS0354_019345 [Potamilus streckersoni]|uniref:Uncharacterized protein n=1 Tax=Potamilus streckersoni TaxID=2493646 RepID=A0AAE0SII6_9BIVA|nr:hypothetical protein CHS0354_019345 [Potamilus streckersoni]